MERSLKRFVQTLRLDGIAAVYTIRMSKSSTRKQLYPLDRHGAREPILAAVDEVDRDDIL